MDDKGMLQKFQTEELRKNQGETLSVLDALRRSRKSRGGVGEPLQVPANLQDAAQGKPTIIVTDADLKS
jgi:hypothetical protein